METETIPVSGAMKTMEEIIFELAPVRWIVRSREKISNLLLRF